MDNSLKNGLMAQSMDLSQDEQVGFLAAETAQRKEDCCKVPFGLQVCCVHISS